MQLNQFVVLFTYQILTLTTNKLQAMYNIGGGGKGLNETDLKQYTAEFSACHPPRPSSFACRTADATLVCSTFRGCPRNVRDQLIG